MTWLGGSARVEYFKIVPEVIMIYVRFQHAMDIFTIHLIFIDSDTTSYILYILKAYPVFSINWIQFASRSAPSSNKSQVPMRKI